MTDEIYRRLKERVAVAEQSLREAKSDLADYERIAETVDVAIPSDDSDSMADLTQREQIERYLRQNGPSPRSEIIKHVDEKAVRNYLRSEFFGHDSVLGLWTIHKDPEIRASVVKLLTERFASQDDSFSISITELHEQARDRYGVTENQFNEVLNDLMCEGSASVDERFCVGFNPFFGL